MKAERAAIALFSLLAILLLWKFLRPYPLPPAQIILPPELPAISPASGNELLSLIRRHNIWSQNREEVISSSSVDNAAAAASAQAAGTAAVDTSWRLLGVSTQAGQQLAVVDGPQGLHSFEVGDTLPDGATIIEIMSFGIQINRLGKNESVYLFGKL